MHCNAGLVPRLRERDENFGSIRPNSGGQSLPDRRKLLVVDLEAIVDAISCLVAPLFHSLSFGAGQGSVASLLLPLM